MYGKMQTSGLIEIIPLIMYLSYLGPVSCAISSWVSWGCTVGGWMQLLMAWWQAILFLSWVASGLTIGEAVMWWLDGCNIFCLLIWQATFFHSHTFTQTPELLKWNKRKIPFLFWWGYRAISILLYCQWEWKLVQPLKKTISLSLLSWINACPMTQPFNSWYIFHRNWYICPWKNM